MTGTKMFIFFTVGKCECKGVLTGSNQGIMALDFGIEVSNSTS